MVSLIKRLTTLPVTYVTQEGKSNHLVNKLLRQANVHFITPAAINDWQQKNILVISRAHYEFIKKTWDLPLFLAHLCGERCVKRNLVSFVTQELQLSVQPLPKNASVKAELGYFNVRAWESYVDKLPSLVELWLRVAKAGGNHLSVADSTGVKLSHHRLITAVMTLRTKLSKKLAGETHIGLCLPPSVGCVTALLALLSLGKTSVNLNYTAAKETLDVVVEETAIRIVITSRHFLETLKKRGFSIANAFNTLTVIFLEDVRNEITQRELLKNFLLVKALPFSLLRSRLVTPCSTASVACILFSSGSEGKPKGVELLHKNIVGNAKQCSETFENISTDDRLLGILPIFHVFGLTTTTLMALIENLGLICHPDPMDTKTIGKLTHDYQATLLCGTPTFLRFYAKAKHITAEMFSSLRLIVAAGEKLLPEVRSLFEEKFKKRIYEGYGTTELSPVASVNLPDTHDQICHKSGTVGRPIAGCMIRILNPDTNEDLPVGEAGMVTISGVNIMQGYLLQPEKTRSVIFYQQGIRWYKTGDKGYLDDQDFLTILDRYSRFAKLGGEMVSLGAVEEQITSLINRPEIEMLAVAIPSTKKGEEIVLIYAGQLSPDEIRQLVLRSSMTNLMKPQHYWHVDAIPKLGTGKLDFVTTKQQAIEHFSKK